MSLDIITKNYIDNYKLKGTTPEWLTLLTKTVNSRNISTVDWNIAMDDIRKVASDSVTTYNFITAFNKEFNDYYTRSIKSVEYTTDTEDKINPSEYSETIENSEYIITFNESTMVRYIQIYLDGSADSNTLYIELSSDGTAFGEPISLNMPVGNSDVRLVDIGGMYVKCVKLYQASGSQILINNIEFFKDNITGSFVITRYDDVKFTIPMVDPETFASQIQAYVYDAERLANEADVSANNAHESELNALNYEVLASQHMDGAEHAKGVAENARDEASKSASDANTYLEELKDVIADSTDETNTANKLLRLDGTGKIPAQFIPTEKTIDMFHIQSEADLTTLSKAQLGDIAYIVNKDGDADANYRLIGDDYSDRKNWILQTTSYVSQAAVADRAVEAENTTKVNGVLVRIGNYDSYKKADTEGLYIITDYSESES